MLSIDLFFYDAFIFDAADGVLEGIDDVRADVTADEDAHDVVTDSEVAFGEPGANVVDAGQGAGFVEHGSEFVGIVREVHGADWLGVYFAGTDFGFGVGSDDTGMAEIHADFVGVGVMFGFSKPGVNGWWLLGVHDSILLGICA